MESKDLEYSMYKEHMEKVYKSCIHGSMLDRLFKIMASTLDVSGIDESNGRRVRQKTAIQQSDDDPQLSPVQRVARARFALGNDDGAYLRLNVMPLQTVIDDNGCESDDMLRISTKMTLQMQNASYRGLLNAYDATCKDKLTQQTKQLSVIWDVISWLNSIDEVKDFLRNALQDTSWTSKGNNDVPCQNLFTEKCETTIALAMLSHTRQDGSMPDMDDVDNVNALILVIRLLASLFQKQIKQNIENKMKTVDDFFECQVEAFREKNKANHESNNEDSILAVEANVASIAFALARGLCGRRGPHHLVDKDETELLYHIPRRRCPSIYDMTMVICDKQSSGDNIGCPRYDLYDSSGEFAELSEPTTNDEAIWAPVSSGGADALDESQVVESVSWCVIYEDFIDVLKSKANKALPGEKMRILAHIARAKLDQLHHMADVFDHAKREGFDKVCPASEFKIRPSQPNKTRKGLFEQGLNCAGLFKLREKSVTEKEKQQDHQDQQSQTDEQILPTASQKEPTPESGAESNTLEEDNQRLLEDNSRLKGDVIRLAREAKKLRDKAKNDAEQALEKEKELADVYFNEKKMREKAEKAQEDAEQALREANAGATSSMASSGVGSSGVQGIGVFFKDQLMQIGTSAADASTQQGAAKQGQTKSNSSQDLGFRHVPFGTLLSHNDTKYIIDDRMGDFLPAGKMLLDERVKILEERIQTDKARHQLNSAVQLQPLNGMSGVCQPGERCEKPILETMARVRREEVWNDSMREAAISGDRLYAFVRQLSGTIHEAVDAVCVVDESMLVKQQRDRQEDTKRLSAMASQQHMQLVSNVFRSVISESGLTLGIDSKKGLDGDLKVVSNTLRKQVSELASGSSSSEGFFSNSVRLENLLQTGTGEMTLQVLFEKLKAVGMALQRAAASEATEGVPQESSSLEFLSAPRNSLILRYKPETHAAIRSAFDTFQREMRARQYMYGYFRSRKISAFELLEGVDDELSMAFATFCGHNLAHMRLFSAGHAAYMGQWASRANIAAMKFSLDKLISVAARYMVQHDRPGFLSPRGWAMYFGTQER